MSASIGRLAAAIGLLRKTEEIERFLQELLTPGEVHDLALRWELVELLSAGVSQRQIAARLGISLCKITRGAKILKKRNGAVAELVLRGRGASEQRKTVKAKSREVVVAPQRKPETRHVAKPARGRTVKAATKGKTVTSPKPRKAVKKHGTRVARKS